MSLLDIAFTDCTMITFTETEDDNGGFASTPVAGATLEAAFVLNGSQQDTTANVESIKETYTVITRKANILSFHDVIRRDSDQKCFRVITNGGDHKTPATASLNMSAVTAEVYKYE